MNKKILEVVNQLIILTIYAIIFSRGINKSCFNTLDNILTIFGIILSISLMFYLWSIKE